MCRSGRRATMSADRTWEPVPALGARSSARAGVSGRVVASIRCHRPHRQQRGSAPPRLRPAGALTSGRPLAPPFRPAHAQGGARDFFVQAVDRATAPTCSDPKSWPTLAPCVPPRVTPSAPNRVRNGRPQKDGPTPEPASRGAASSRTACFSCRPEHGSSTGWVAHRPPAAARHVTSHCWPRSTWRQWRRIGLDRSTTGRLAGGRCSAAVERGRCRWSRWRRHRRR
jgi:hypothetical protein